MSQSRQLAAIMFTDIVGYTALMGTDEEKALALLDKNRDLQKPIIEKYHGEWLKEIGDGVLASFGTVSDAVYCAAAIQKACELEADLTLRIGIHQGEVVFRNNDVFGDGVNIASRLESMAPAGGILVSDAIHRNVTNKKGIVSEFKGEEVLKGVNEPVKVYQVHVEGVEVPSKVTLSVKPNVPNHKASSFFNFRKFVIPSLVILILLALVYFFYSGSSGEDIEAEKHEVIERSIAVLPFDNESSEQENEYFVNGMTEDIRNNISKISGLRVVSKTSSEKYGDTGLSTIEIGQELEVNYILEGTAQKIGSQVKIHAQLINTETDGHVWNQTYLRDISEDFTELFEIQSEIAENVASELEITLTLRDQELIDAIPTNNMAAYDAYLQANELRSKWTVYLKLEDFKSADSLYKIAEAADPSFVGPLVGRASLYISANRIISLSESYPISDALKLLDKALEIDSSSTIAYKMRAFYHTRIGETRKAYFDRQMVFKLNPHDPGNTYALGVDNFRNQNYIVGLQLAHRGLRLLGKEVSVWQLHNMGFMYLELYDVEKAIFHWDKMVSIDNDIIIIDLSTRVHLYDYLGQWDVSIRLIEEYDSLYPDNKKITFERLGMHYTKKREFEQALHYFNKADQLTYPDGGWDEWVLESRLYQGIALNETGQVSEGLAMLHDCLSTYMENLEKSYVWDPEVIVAGIHVYLGDKQQAYNWLRKSKWRSLGLLYAQQDVIFSNINREKEFQDLVGSVMEERKEVREEIARLTAAGEWEI